MLNIHLLYSLVVGCRNGNRKHICIFLSDGGGVGEYFANNFNYWTIKQATVEGVSVGSALRWRCTSSVSGLMFHEEFPVSCPSTLYPPPPPHTPLSHHFCSSFIYNWTWQKIINCIMKSSRPVMYTISVYYRCLALDPECKWIQIIFCLSVEVLMQIAHRCCFHARQSIVHFIKCLSNGCNSQSMSSQGGVKKRLDDCAQDNPFRNLWNDSDFFLTLWFHEGFFFLIYVCVCLYV